MTDAAKASVWTAVWQPWGTPQSLTGTATLDARFPGQWYQLEAGLHYNWHRSYDPSLGRYTQPDPLGFVDGPSVYGYAIANPQRFVDLDGRMAQPLPDIDPRPEPNIPPEPSSPSDGLAQCAYLKAQTWYYCKILNSACHGVLDNCDTIAKKISDSVKCIVSQTRYTSMCFSPEDQSHFQRPDDQENKIQKCKNIAKQKNCNVCVK